MASETVNVRRGVYFPGMPRHTVRQKLIDVSEELTASIFRADEKAKQTTSKKETIRR
jgi:hypothetical protein